MSSEAQIQSQLTHVQSKDDIRLEELLKMYNENHSTVDEHVSKDEESYNSSDIDDDEEEDIHHHHLFHANEIVLSNEESYESEIVPLINIGNEYQAEIDSSKEHSDVHEVSVDELLWSPSSLDDDDDDDNNENIDEYLQIIHDEYPSSDDEISLQMLLNCQLNIESALDHFRQLSQKTIHSYSAWSLTEIEEFEQGLREYGKNFYKIFLFKCPNRSVREVVHFYYQWKKTDRHPIFLAQQRFHPFSSVSHIIEKFIEEQATISKKRSFDQVDNDDDATISTKKSSIEIQTTTVT